MVVRAQCPDVSGRLPDVVGRPMPDVSARPKPDVSARPMADVSGRRGEIVAGANFRAIDGPSGHAPTIKARNQSAPSSSGESSRTSKDV